MISFYARTLLLIVSIITNVSCFSLSVQDRSFLTRKSHVSNVLQASSTSSIDSNTKLDMTEKGLLKRDRYVATNRFAVRSGQQAKFEKRWATRKSRLATLPGFQYFHLMRRVTLHENVECKYDEGVNDEAAQENYVSFTIWNKKSDFSAWRSGEAFKEAHGGTSITAFLSTMVNSALILRGAPRPAFYDGLLLQKSGQPQVVPETVDGWRNVQADGINTLPAECFVEFVKYYIPSGEAAAIFEQQWMVKEIPATTKGFVASTLLRRDGQAKGHGVTPMDSREPTYVGTTIFQDRKSFEEWVASHPKAAIDTQRAPETVYYEGTLVISCADGA